MRNPRSRAHAEHNVHPKIHPGDVETMMSRENFPLLSRKIHTERYPSRMLKISLLILGGGVGLALAPLYIFSLDVSIPELMRHQDFTGIYLLSAYLLFVALVGLWRFGKRRQRAWMEREGSV